MKVREPEAIFLKMFVYGDPGTGKTWLIDSANDDPRSAPVLHLECSGNPIAIVRRPNRFVVSVENLKDFSGWYTFLHTRKVPKDIESILKHWKERDGEVPTFKTVAIDQLTDLQARQMDIVTENVRKGIGEIPTGATRQNYQAILGLMTKFARMYYDLPMHVVMTAWERIKYEGDPPRATGYRASLVGQSEHVVPGFSEIVTRLTTVDSLTSIQKNRMKVKDGYNLALFSGLGAMARTLWPAMGDHMIDPTFTTLLDAAEEGGGAETTLSF